MEIKFEIGDTISFYPNNKRRKIFVQQGNIEVVIGLRLSHKIGHTRMVLTEKTRKWR